MLQIEFRAFGSTTRALIDAEGEAAVAALAQVPEWFEQWERRLSRFRSESGLSRLNQRRGMWTPVGSTLWRVARCAAWAARVTGGLVVPYVLDDLVRAGYDRPFDALDGRAGSDRPTGAGGAEGEARVTAGRRAGRRAPQLRRRGRLIRVSPSAGLDLAGVAKAWAGQETAYRLACHGPVLVDVGGDIVVTAPPRGSAGWPIGVQLSGDTHEIVLGAGGVATSGTDFRRWRSGSEVRHHIIDPRTGRPAQTDVVTATVVAPSVLEADVAAKAMVILGSRAGPVWLAGRPQCGALLALENGSVVTIPAPGAPSTTSV